ncbi:MAG: hypothetical protein II765_03770 [Lachnospiraceae bacterium]|nr:hypothetical protein [Lachnospiraceae bacterium]
MEKVIRRKENVLNKIKPSYPTKDKINFAEIDVTPMKIEVVAPAIVVIIIVACLLSKFLVVDRLIAYNKQAAEVASMESELQAAYDKIDSYSDMEEKYAHYTYSGMTPDEMALQDRVAVVELINKYILTKAEVGAWTITGNEVNIPITGVSFQEVGAIAAELEKDDMVDHCEVVAATTNDNGNVYNSSSSTITAVNGVGGATAQVTIYLNDVGEETTESEGE